MSRPVVIQTEDLDPSCAGWLRERADLRAVPSDDPAFAEELAAAEALVVRTYTKVDGALLAQAPSLKVVGRAGVGLDNIDINACAARGVRVVYTPDANSQAVVELALAFLLDALRPRTFLDRAPDHAEWKALRSGLVAPRQLADITVGVLGLGRVGTRLARAMRALGCRVLYCDLREIPEGQREGAQPVSFETLLRESDAITIHIDNRPSNRHIINAETLALCTHDLIFLNIARGFVIDARALAAFLAENPAALAMLDVHEPEPFGPDYPLLGLPNARLSPHIGAATATAHRNMSWVVRDVWRVLQGEEPEHEATPENQPR